MTDSYSLNTYSDMELLARVCKSDDTKAFRALYERYWEKLYNLACRKLGSESDASDIVQNIFVKLWEKRKTLAITQSLDGYLFISLKNYVINFYKADSNHKKHLSIFCSSFLSDDETSYRQSNFKELHQHIDKEIKLLPEKMREVFVLSRNNHLTAKQIAEKLSISEQTVRNQISDAIHRIRRSIAGKP